MSNLCKCGHSKLAHNSENVCVAQTGRNSCPCNEFQHVNTQTPVVENVAPTEPVVLTTVAFDLRLLTPVQQVQFIKTMQEAGTIVERALLAHPEEDQPDSEMVVQINKFFDVLRRFYDNKVDLTVAPAPKGWHTSFKPRVED